MAAILKYDPSKAVPHPLGVRPRGNMFLAESVEDSLDFKQKSLGLFGTVSEDLLCNEMLAFCDSRDLVRLSEVSNYVRAYSFHNDLWRTLCLGANLTLNCRDSWRETFLSSSIDDSSPSNKKQRTEDHEEDSLPVRVRNVFSDLLFEPYRMSGLSPSPAWMARDTIERVDYKSLSKEEFIAKYEKKNKPVIIAGFVNDCWGGINKKLGNMDALLTTFGDQKMECGSVKMTMSEFESYIASDLCRLDECPIFVFDTKTFNSFTVEPKIPVFENTDLFDLLECDWRPDNKWLLVGASGASSKWHIDPNSTNAWNAVLCGEKRWILVPPHLGPPPGVEVSGDGFAVRQPVSLTDWLEAGFYHDTKGIVEGTCRAGEVMFIPRGWWHGVRNTGNELTIAITQNYAAESSCHQVRRFLKEMSHCVSGVGNAFRSTLWREFDNVLRAKRPDLLADSQSEGDAVKANEECTQIESDNESCCGGETTEFSFWGHFESRNKTLNFER